MVALVPFLLSLLALSASACDRCAHQTKATYFHNSLKLSSGDCGYGNLASSLSNGNFAAGASSLFKQGAGCGACFQLRCKDGNLCSANGTTVMLTDATRSNHAGFVLSTGAFMALAKTEMASHLLNKGVVDVEYQRIPCQYNHNMALRVEETSRRPSNLVVKVLYQGGQTEIVAMDVATIGSSNWVYLSRLYGAVWNTTRAPTGALQFRFVVTSGYDGKWVWARSVLPQSWTPGTIYSTGVQINDIALEGCFPCRAGK